MQSADAAPRASKPQATSRLITWRVIAFVVVLLGVLAVAALIVTRADPAWAVALDGNTVVVKEGDEIRERTPLQLNQLTPDVRSELLRATGKRVEDRAAAKAYIDSIALQAAQAGTLPLPGAAVIATTTSTPSTPSTGGTAPPPGGSIPDSSVPIGP